jgi:hypothetical protein
MLREMNIGRDLMSGSSRPQGDQRFSAWRGGHRF